MRACDCGASGSMPHALVCSALDAALEVVLGSLAAVGREDLCVEVSSALDPDAVGTAAVVRALRQRRDAGEG